MSQAHKPEPDLRSLLETGSAVLQDPYPIENAHSEKA